MQSNMIIKIAILPIIQKKGKQPWSHFPLFCTRCDFMLGILHIEYALDCTVSPIVGTRCVG